MKNYIIGNLTIRKEKTFKGRRSWLWNVLMKKIKLSILVLFFTSLIGCSQTSKVRTEVQDLNFDFEQIENGFPIKWVTFGSQDLKIYVDSIHTKSGKFSVIIENTESDPDFKAIAFKLPNNYNGKSIRLSGFIKTENVTGGYAGLWMRMEPEVASDDMHNRGITGTTDWKEYEITLPLSPQKTDRIVVGGYLRGKGKIWLDNLRVTIDGKDLDDKSLEILKVEIDTEFDKGSNIAFPDLNSETINNLELLGRVWGFLKYHHPKIAKGNYNWDYELLRFLPKYLNIKNQQERDNALVNWIKKYGQIPSCKTCEPTAGNAVLKPDLSWFEKSNLSNNLKSLLTKIYNNRNQGENQYIALHRDIGNPDFKNENPYYNMPHPDSGFRLLSLYRYWNMIEYFYPNKHLPDKKWDTVLKEYIPKFINAKDELEYELAALQVIGEINDTHANLWGGGDQLDKLRGNKFAPFKAEFVENKLVVTDYFNPELLDKAKLKIGDVITHIDGKTVESIVDSLRPYYPSSNEVSMLRDISADLLRSAKNTINLKYLSNNRNQAHDITLYDKERLNIYHWSKENKEDRSFKMLDGNIGYITLANIERGDFAEIKKTFKDTKGIIIDIRNYPSTPSFFPLGAYFVSEPTAFVKITQANLNNPGEFTFRRGRDIKPDYNTPKTGYQRRIPGYFGNTQPDHNTPANNYEGKLVVLINEKSQSQAEFTAMAFRASKTSTIIGSTTAGADGDVSTITLPGGLSTMISGIGIYYPDGTETQRVGIVPDVIIKPTINGIKKGKDEVLEKAIEIINQ